MVKTKFFICFSLLLIINFTSVALSKKHIIKQDTLRIMTWNIRIAIDADTGLSAWKNRKENVALTINKYKPHIAGIQEILNQKQQNEFTGYLQNYNYIAYGRDNSSGTEGERVAIIYDKKRFSLNAKGFFFLSQTPEVLSRGWDAALNRICMWVKLVDKSTQQTLFVFNTHFDHVGKIARAESAKLIVTKIQQIAGGNPVLLLGDFNANPFEAEVYMLLSSKLNESSISAKIILNGTEGTFNGWDFRAKDFDATLRIDYIFAGKMNIHSYQTINDRNNAGVYPSDHFPVTVTATFNFDDIDGLR